MLHTQYVSMVIHLARPAPSSAVSSALGLLPYAWVTHCTSVLNSSPC